jgi:hypothetical protein
MLMNMRNKTLSLLLFVATLGGTVSAYAVVDHDEYVEAVMNVMRTHVDLLQGLSQTHHFRYSDNVVRHAMAIERTFGLLGPMEWHAAVSAQVRAELQGDKVDLDEDHFEDLGKATRNSMRTLIRAAHDSMGEYEQDGLSQAIDDFKQSCNNCHMLLPRSVAPDLWGPLKRELGND